MSAARNVVAEAAKWLNRWRDPVLFVQEAFPWGEPGPLQPHSGPDTWQLWVLEQVRDGLSPHKAVQVAVASGHGPGKSALVAWLILWAIATEVDARGVVTANTDAQLRGKTWPEVTKWYRLAKLIPGLFQVTATALYSRERERTWRIDIVPWSENNTEAFAGLHNQGRRLIVIYDEASAIPDVIWETTEGALTDDNTEIIWAVFGNPTRNTGRFRECFGRFRHRWTTKQVDSRSARLTNKTLIEQWIKDYGDDSDFVRVRVKGQFPRAGSMQFIGSDVAEAAASATRDPPVGVYDPLVMGVDVARYGDDQTVIWIRRGRDARTYPPIRIRGQDTMTVAARVAELNNQYKPDAIFIDEGGVGAGVVDRCRFLKLPVVGVHFGAKADSSVETSEGRVGYANKRAEMWGVMRDWLNGGMIPDDPEILADLTGVEYGYTMKEGRDCIILEKKEDMKKRGLASPDNADALALTFAYPVAKSDHSFSLSRRHAFQSDYNPFGALHQGQR